MPFRNFKLKLSLIFFFKFPNDYTKIQIQRVSVAQLCTKKNTVYVHEIWAANESTRTRIHLIRIKGVRVCLATRVHLLEDDRICPLVGNAHPPRGYAPLCK